MAVKLYAALDVSLNKTAICVMDEAEVATCPEAISRLLLAYRGELERVGLEAGPMSEWLVRGLAEAGIEAVLMETRQAQSALRHDRQDRSERCTGTGAPAPNGMVPAGACEVRESSERGSPGVRHWSAKCEIWRIPCVVCCEASDFALPWCCAAAGRMRFVGSSRITPACLASLSLCCKPGTHCTNS
jgi:hypothetical protein